MARADLVVSAGMVDYPLVTALDLVMILDSVAVASATGLLAPDALVLIDEQIEAQPQDSCRILPLSLVQTARSVGSLRATNIVALGALNEVAGMVSTDTLEAVIRQRVPAKFQQLNLDAFSAGAALAAQPIKPVAAIGA
jgi:2-oxoglutarate ferredoxin oxidoreductase subunit gamma